MINAVRHIVPEKPPYFHRSYKVSFGEVQVNDRYICFRFIHKNGNTIDIPVYSSGGWVMRCDLWEWKERNIGIVTINIWNGIFGSSMRFEVFDDDTRSHEYIFSTIGVALRLFGVVSKEKEITF